MYVTFSHHDNNNDEESRAAPTSYTFSRWCNIPPSSGYARHIQADHTATKFKCTTKIYTSVESHTYLLYYIVYVHTYMYGCVYIYKVIYPYMYTFQFPVHRVLNPQVLVTEFISFSIRISRMYSAMGIEILTKILKFM